MNARNCIGPLASERFWTDSVLGLFHHLLLAWFILNGPKRAILPIPSANREEVINWNQRVGKTDV
jgi:hypothetical protein